MTEDTLEEALSRPRLETETALSDCPGDVIVLGAGGKMGPTLARMVRRAAKDDRRVIAVSRWSSKDARRTLDGAGVETVSCDLLDRDAVDRLPDAPNVLFMAGQKFGTSGAPALTWGMNTLVPAHCAERYRASRIVAFSTGNVYPLTSVSASGSRESDKPAPVGEYAASCLGRERIFELFAHRHATRVALIRLNYAVDLRYGVLVDIAVRVRDQQPISLEMGYANAIWQGDANRIAIEAFPHASAPPFIVNVTGAERLSVRRTAEWFGERFGVAPRFTGAERDDALLSDTTRMRETFAPPETTTDELLSMVGDWIERGGALLGKPTKFEARDGKF